MKFQLNGIALGGDSQYKIQAPVVGLEKPPIRMGAGEWSGRDGGYVSNQYYGTRVIVLNGFYIGTTCEEADALRAGLTDSMPIRQSLPLFITTFGGKLLFTQTYLRDFKMEMTNPLAGIFQITLVAPDPFLYDAGDGINPDSGWIELPVYKLIGGGYITEYNMPVQWTPGTTPAVAVNSGDVTIFPQFKITGVVTNPTITNFTANKFVKVMVTTSQPTDVVIIDMGQRTVTLNGSSILSLRTLDSQWWGLTPGNNTIQFESDGVSDVNFGTLRWRTAYQGA
jgi:tail protein